ncbi:MAG: hypothetical protein JKX98_10625 [Alcanivoracaceae bacterium]|nr:hypothetical protein [Alcanivoracaceae bacterium]
MTQLKLQVSKATNSWVVDCKIVGKGNKVNVLSWQIFISRYYSPLE